MGECMLEVQANSFGSAMLSYGGDTFNTAVYLRRCSHPNDIQVGYATGLGNDPLSKKLMKEWQSLGLDLSGSQQIEGKLPGLYLIETDDTGERLFHFWRENSAARDYFESITTPLEQKCEDIDCLYLSGISLAILNNAARDRLFTLMGRLKANGKQVVFDNNYRPKLWADRITTQQVFEQAFSLSTLALITADDHQQVFGLPHLEDAVAHAQQLNVAELVIKRGASPTLVHNQDKTQWQEVNAYPVAKVIDTTAAGDSFAAGYLSKRLVGKSAVESADFGNRIASRVVQHRGAIVPMDVMIDLI